MRFFSETEASSAAFGGRKISTTTTELASPASPYFLKERSLLKRRCKWEVVIEVSKRGVH